MKKTALLVLIIFTALAVRLWGIDFGLPNFFFHTDENLFVNFAHQLVQYGRYPKDKFQDIPLIYTDLPFVNILALLIRVIFKGERTFRNLNLLRGPQGLTFAQLRLALRIISALISTLTTYVTYKATSQIYNRKIGLLAATVLTFTFLDVQISHYVKQDVHIGFLSALALLLGYQIFLKGDLFSYFAFGLLTGLSAAIKLNGAVFIISLLSAHLLRNWEKTKNQLHKLVDHKILLAGLCTISGFIFGHAYEWFGSEKLINNFSSFLTPVGIPFTASNADGTPTPFWWMVYLSSSGLFYPFFIAAVGGIFLMLKKHRKKELFLLAFPAFYFTLLSIQSHRFDRYAIPLTPYLAIFSAVFLYQLFQSVWHKKGWSKIRRASLVSLTAFVFIGIPAGRILAFDYLLAQKDTREAAVEWVENNINKDEDIILLGTRHLRWELGRRGYTNITYDRAAANDNTFDFRDGIFIVAGSTVQEAANYQQISKYQHTHENLNYLLENGETLAHFSQPLFARGFFSPPSLEHASTVNAYHQPQIWIIRCPSICGKNKKVTPSS